MDEWTIDFILRQVVALSTKFVLSTMEVSCSLPSVAADRRNAAIIVNFVATRASSYQRDIAR